MTKDKIDVFVESCYPADRSIIRNAAREVLEENSVKSKTELGINIVGDRKMARLNKKYRGKEETTPVLAFSQMESAQAFFPEAPDDVLRLGDVVISYRQARELAKERNKLVDEMICELVKHGTSKLLEA